MKRIFPISLAVATVGVLLWAWTNQPVVPQAEAAKATEAADASETQLTAIATLAGGCFWCMESTFEKLDGVHEVVSGYTGGHLENPTYRQVGGGGTGHTEAVQVHYDPNTISYRELLHHFWREIDPTDTNGQFVDRGSMYRPAIYYHSEEEMALAVASRDRLAASGRFDKPIVVEIAPAETFYQAESYHQDYYQKKSSRYKVYRYGSGRDQFLQRVWGDDLHADYEEDEESEESEESASATHDKYGKPADSVLRTQLSEMQYRVTQQDGTEPPFRNEFWDNKQPGIYVDIVSGEPLFSSTDKYRSGTGWPSFSRPIDEHYLVEKADYKLLFPRVELRSKYGDSHLGHVFNDGPAPTGLRYCINSASLRFIAANQLEQEGYGEYAELFE